MRRFLQRSRDKTALSAVQLFFARAWLAFKILFRLTDRGAWVDDGVLGCAYPRTERAFADMARRDVSVLVNLHEQAHDPVRLMRHGLVEVHLPVSDFVPPTTEQLERGVTTIIDARARGKYVAVHCGGGLGRTGTLLACYVVRRKRLGVPEAIDQVRRTRPGSVETRAQTEAVEAYALRFLVDR